MAQDILELLGEHDCVIIPGIGALVANYQPAQVNYAGKTIYPPSKTLFFNRNLKYNDGLLSGYIAQKNLIDYEEARSMVDRLAQDINSRIKKGQYYRLEDLGYFYADQKYLVSFQPEVNSNLMLESYGLSFVQYKNEVLPVRPGKPRRTLHTSAVPSQRHRIRNWALAAAAASILAAALILTLQPVTTDSGIRDLGTLGPSGKAHEVVSPTEQSAAASSGTGITVRRDVPAGAPEVQAGDFMYHIVVGSFVDFAHAREQIRSIRGRGYEARLLFTEGDHFRVSVYSSHDREASGKKLREIRTSLNKDAWLYRE